MTARRLLLAALFCSVFLIGLIAFAPASLMGFALARASGGTLSLAQTTGSLWQGSGVALLKNKSHQQTLGSYRWKLHPFDASLQLWTSDSTPTTVRYLPLSNRVDIDKLHIILPASAIELAAPQLGPYQLQGMFDAHSEQLSLDTKGLNGQISVDWMNAASALSAIRPLGDYRIVLQGKGGGVDAQLSTLSGKLLLNGTGSFDPRNGMQLNGTAQAAPGSAATELNELLHHIGPEVRPGVFKLALMPQPGMR
ncbi:MAG: type II secretion system protein N [Gammaproteobacteria bacterium]|nr:type II secretion system protein N [Gammaproteobacteria bacterium]MBU1777317.1 type II secretion system protein N [Gammaproteobacteria bacterium]MBU1968307.1 type II secretion system protein N [Gammaproteobacteria bacterium]